MRRTQVRGLLVVVVVAAAGQAAMAQGVVWSNAVGSPGVGAGGVVNVLHVSSVQGSPRLYVGGEFAPVSGGTASANIAAWDGHAWSPVGAPVIDGEVLAIDTIDLGNGPRLFASGLFWLDLPGVPTMARLEGGTWSTLASGPDAPNTWVGFMRQVPSASGPTLWASGGFTDYVAAWNGTSWTVPGGGLTSTIHDSVAFDDGSGARLHFTGTFTSQSNAAIRMLASWNGAAFEDVGGGLGGVGYTLAVYDDGRGPALYVGGSFNRVGAFPDWVSAWHIARWSGTHWEPLGSGMNNAVHDLAVFDDGSGPKLYATGEFTMAGGQPAARIARWDGARWQAIGTGLTAPTGGGGRALQVFDPDGAGPAPAKLYIGGQFSAAGGRAAASIAALVPCPAELDGDATLGVQDIFAYLTLWFTGDARAEFDGAAGIGVPDIIAFLGAWFAGCE